MRRDDGGAPDAQHTPTVSEEGLSRRDAIKVLGASSLLATLGVSAPQMERALRMLRAETSIIADTASSTAQLATFAPRFFTAHEWATVRMLADYVIPRDARSGSATDAKVPEFMDTLFADPDGSPASKLAMRGGLAWLDTESARRFGKTFVAATDLQRRQVLDDIAWPAKARPDMSHGVAFFTRFRDLTASGFFSSAMGWQDVHYQGNVFNPSWDGCPPAALAKLGVRYE